MESIWFTDKHSWWAISSLLICLSSRVFLRSAKLYSKLSISKTKIRLEEILYLNRPRYWSLLIQGLLDLPSPCNICFRDIIFWKKSPLNEGKYSLGNGSTIPIDCDIEMKYLCQLSNTSHYTPLFLPRQFWTSLRFCQEK